MAFLQHIKCFNKSIIFPIYKNVERFIKIIMKDYKKVRRRYQIFVKKNKEKCKNMAMKDTSIYQKMKSKHCLSIGKNIIKREKTLHYNYKKLFSFRKFSLFLGLGYTSTRNFFWSHFANAFFERIILKTYFLRELFWICIFIGAILTNTWVGCWLLYLLLFKQLELLTAWNCFELLVLFY